MANMPTGPDGIHIGVDLGASGLKVSGTFQKNGMYLIAADVLILQNQRIVPAAVAYHDGLFYWGHNLQDLVANGDIPAENVIAHYKPVLYPVAEDTDADTLETIRLALHQISDAGVTPFVLYVDLLTHLLAATRERMCQSQLGHILSKEEILSAPFAARITLPQSFDLVAARKLISAAKKAGISVVNITTEQLCALAAYLDNLKGDAPFSEDDPFILVDAGCFTVDSVLYYHRGGQGTMARFEATAQSRGSVFGSFRVNRLVQATIEGMTPGGMESHYKRLGVSAGNFNFQLQNQIEMAKKNFNHNRAPLSYLATIHIEDHDSNEKFEFRLTQKIFQEAFDIVFDENCQGVDALIKEHASSVQNAVDDSVFNKHAKQVKKSSDKQKLEFIVLTGGGCQCAYVRTKYEKRYKQQGITIISVADQMNREPIHVAKGALSSRYESITTQELPLRYDLAFLLDELFRFDQHPDCWVKRTRRDAIKKKVRTQIPGAPTCDRIVLDRLRFLGRKGQVLSEIKGVQVDFNPRVDEPVYELRTVFTDAGRFNEHDAALEDDHDVSRNDNKLRAGVSHWAKGRWDFDKEVMSSGGWKTAKDTSTGRYHYQNVKAILSIIRSEDKSLKVELELVFPGADGKTMNLDKTSKVPGSFDLYDSSMSEFVSDADAGYHFDRGTDEDGDSQMT